MVNAKRMNRYTLYILVAALFIGMFPSYQANAAEPNSMEDRSPGVIGWDGDKDGVIAYMDGSFKVRDGINATYGFGIYNHPSSLQWHNANGYLPTLVTKFERNNSTVTLTNFGDKVSINGRNYLVVYSRVTVYNHGSAPVTLDPQASTGLIPLTANSFTVNPGQTVNHDYAVGADRFGNSYSYPTAAELLAAGGWDIHFTHMQNYWNAKLAGIVQINQLPDTNLINAYKAGYIYTYIISDGNNLNVGENGYDVVFDHDAIGIMAGLLTLGDTNVKPYLSALQAQLQYQDAKWKFSWPFAMYYYRTGDIAFIQEQWSNIKANTHTIETDRTGPDGIMMQTYDIDSLGYWTVDNYSALFGLLTYKYLAQQVGDSAEVTWANGLYNSLLASVNAKLSHTMSQYGLNYMPCSMVEPNTANRCSEPRDANWASPFLFGRWAWDGYLFGGAQSGVTLDKIDETYDYGFNRLKGVLPKDDFGGYPGAFYSSAYNAGYGSAGLRGEKYRTQGIKSYQFMINRTSSAPYSWWESLGYPNLGMPWNGMHALGGQGSSPHMWGQSVASKVLIDSIVSEKVDGTLIIGRGVPDEWTTVGQVIDLSNIPSKNNNRLGIHIASSGSSIKLMVSGTPQNQMLFNLPVFKNNISSVSVGTFDNDTGTVTIPSNVQTVTVNLVSGAATGGNLDVYATNQTGNVNFTAEGNGDWVHFGLTNAGSINRKNIPTSSIQYAQIGSGLTAQFTDSQIPVSWTDGNSTLSVSSTTNGAVALQIGSGWQITVPASTTDRVLKIYTSAWRGKGKLTVSLSDHSAPIDVEYLDSPSNSSYRVYNIFYKANSGNQTLTVKHELVSKNDPNGNITLIGATLTKPVVSGGLYELCAQLSGMCLDVRDGSMSSGAVVQQYTKNNTNAQRWKIDLMSDGYYKLTNINSGLVLDVKDGSLVNGAAIQQYVDNETDAQRWSLTDVGGGYFIIQSKRSGRVLDVTNGNPASGTPIQQYDSNGTSSQKWLLRLL